MPKSTMDPTSRGDMESELVRRWYAANRESAWARFWRREDCADEFILGFMNETRRVGGLSDAALFKEVGPGDGE